MRFSVALLFLPVGLAAGSALAAPPPEIASFLKSHCVKCHGAEKQEGTVRVDDLFGDFAHEGTRWLLVLEQVRTGAMPPEEARQPSPEQRRQAQDWIARQLALQPHRKPSLGNLVPHELLFGAPPAGGHPPPARLWRLGPEAYLAWTRDVARGEVKGLVQPFSANPERGIKDFAALGGVDEPSTEILIRNAQAIVEHQTAHEVVEGRPKGRNGSVREFIDLLAPGTVPTRAQLEKAVQTQFKLAVARPADPEETARLLALYAACAKTGDVAGALQTMLTAVLLQSDAVFRREYGGPDGLLTPREAAAAVSAALTVKREARLFDAVEKGQVTSRADLAGHVKRILDDPGLQKPRLLGFFREYFEYGQAPEVFKDQPKDLWHRPEQHVRDTDRLILHLLEEDRDVFRQLLLTPLAFVNVKGGKDKQTGQPRLERSDVPNPHNQRGQAPLESLYGLQEWTADQPVRQREGTRMGILMQPSWLLAWSENFNNDIVRRGKFIRERLLGGTVPDLPIGVAAMIPEDRERTLRDRVASATRAEACWRCHQRMDELGLPFEQFDHYGRLVREELVLDPVATAAQVDKKGKPSGEVFRGVPLDTTGRIDGSGDPQLDGPVSGPHELVRRLADSDRVRQVWIRHVFRYYLGRNETLADAPTLQAADRAYLASGDSFKALLLSLLTSDSFLLRQPPPVPVAQETP
jgi:hypothetical protein